MVLEAYKRNFCYIGTTLFEWASLKVSEYIGCSIDDLDDEISNARYYPRMWERIAIRQIEAGCDYASLRSICPNECLDDFERCIEELQGNSFSEYLNRYTGEIPDLQLPSRYVKAIQVWQYESNLDKFFLKHKKNNMIIIARLMKEFAFDVSTASKKFGIPTEQMEAYLNGDVNAIDIDKAVQIKKHLVYLKKNGKVFDN